VTCRLKAEITEPEETAVDRQRLGKDIPAAMNAHATEELLDAMFCIRAVSCKRKIGD
jgi:hypothetical protein